MEELNEIIKEINAITLKIEQEYPEFYSLMDEDPITISYDEKPFLDLKTFSDYRDSLNQSLEYLIEHQIN